MTVNKPTHKNMKTRTRKLLPFLAGGAALGLSSLAALAQDGPPPPPPHHGHPPSPIFEALDTNHDGALSADEIKNAATSLATLDKNKDGQLTADEVRPARPEGGPKGEGERHGRGGPGPDADSDEPRGRHRGGPEARDDRRPAPPEDASDSDGRGPGRRREEAGGREHRGPRPVPPIMSALDANHDGVISADEMKNAEAALKTLDKDGDGQLSREEMRPAAPPRRDGAGGPGADGEKGPRPPAE